MLKVGCSLSVDRDDEIRWQINIGLELKRRKYVIQRLLCIFYLQHINYISYTRICHIANGWRLKLFWLIAVIYRLTYRYHHNQPVIVHCRTRRYMAQIVPWFGGFWPSNTTLAMLVGMGFIVETFLILIDWNSAS